MLLMRHLQGDIVEAALNGRMEPGQGVALGVRPKEILCPIESETLQRLEKRLAELYSTAGIPNGTKHNQPHHAWH
jgi:hypothetical protein